MYRGFNLRLNNTWGQKYYEKGITNFNRDKREAQIALDKYVSTDGSIDGSLMQSDWFPQVKADIFISHSHNNQVLAITLAGWLWENFKIRAFIDSCIWGYADDLLKIIDKKYSLNDDKKTYNYNKTKRSASHVHMMLSTALAMMIDRTECLFFLNTPDFIAISEVVDETESPWIYSEIAMSRLVHNRIPRRRQVHDETKLFSKGGTVNEDLRVKYYLNLHHLVSIDANVLQMWKNSAPHVNSDQALDALYDLKEIKGLDLIKG